MNTDILIAVLGVFIGEFYGNFVGGGSLVTQIALQNIIGMDIKPAIALDNAAVLGSNVGMILALWRKYKVQWWFAVFTVFQIVGALLGAWLLVAIDATLLKWIFIATVIGLVVKNLFFPDGEHREKGFDPTQRRIAWLAVAAILIGAYNAAFVIGDWIIALLILTSCFAIKYQQAIFLLVFSMLFSQSAAVYQYWAHGLIDWSFLGPMLVVTLFGGMLAGTLIEKIHSEKLETFLKYLSLGLVVYLVWGLIG